MIRMQIFNPALSQSNLILMYPQMVYRQLRLSPENLDERLGEGRAHKAQLKKKKTTQNIMKFK